MSDTPRTDAKSKENWIPPVIECVPADFARQLERELNKAKAETKNWKGWHEITRQGGQVLAADRDQWKAMAQELADDIASRHGGIFSSALSRFNELNK